MNESPLEPQQPAHLLLVDDEPNILRSLQRLFRSAGYTLHTAEGGAAGLEILAQQPIDLIISDMRMPHMDGAEFLEKAANQWPDTVRILLTGFADIESTIAAVNKGRIYSYFNKPWDDSELKMQVSRAIEQKRMIEERQQLFEIINSQNAQLKDLNTHLEDKVEQRTAQLKSTLGQLDDAHKSLKKQYTETVKAFSKIIEMRPGIKSGHSKYIAEKALLVARKLGMNQEDQKNILYAGLLIQIGKMCLPEALLKKPGHSMSTQEQHQYLNNAVEGQHLLRELSQLKEAGVLIQHQYEKYDGSGFPSALAKEEIPRGARILHVINDYISYLEGSVTGKPMPVSEVQNRLRKRAQRDYDPIIVDAFLEVLEEVHAKIERPLVEISSTQLTPVMENDDISYLEGSVTGKSIPVSEVQNRLQKRTQSDHAKIERRPIVEISWTQLTPGMEVAEISFADRIYLKNCILDEKRIDDIIELRRNVGKNLIFKIYLGANENTPSKDETQPESEHD